MTIWHWITNWLLTFLKFHFHLFVWEHAGVHMPWPESVGESKNMCLEGGFLHYVGPRDRTQATGLGGRCLYLASHLTVYTNMIFMHLRVRNETSDIF